MITIEFNEVRQSFYGRHIFGPLTAQLKGGQITAVTGANGRSIFLPITGMRLDTRLLYSDTSAYYWSASLGSSSSEMAWQLHFKSNEINVSALVRSVGRVIRPVHP